ncbi:unnamed protein product, partial [Rotaria magnacalcarata]
MQWICFLYIDHDQYTLGTLSFVIDQEATGYKDLPEFPLEAPDSSVRNVEVIPSSTSQNAASKRSSA